jgi:hypothetical protein
LGYGDVFESLDAAGVRFVVVGGTAIVLRGHAWRTRDLDLVVEPTPDVTRRATAALLSLGFVPTITLPLEVLSVLTLMHRDGRSADMFARFRIPFDELWADSEQAAAGGRLVRVCTLECLVRLKRIEGRPEEARAIEALLRGKGSRQ